MDSEGFDLIQKQIQSSMEEIEYIFDWEDDWDDDGSVAYNRETLDRAVGFVKLMMAHTLQHEGKLLTVPRFMPGAKGAIEICWWESSIWKVAKWRLVISVPASVDVSAEYYGNGDGIVKGRSLMLDVVSKEISTWLLKQHFN